MLNIKTRKEEPISSKAVVVSMNYQGKKLFEIGSSSSKVIHIQVKKEPSRVQLVI